MRFFSEAPGVQRTERGPRIDLMPTGHQELRDTQPASVELHLYLQKCNGKKKLDGLPQGHRQTSRDAVPVA